jgi:hypothetical protein
MLGDGKSSCGLQPARVAPARLTRVRPKAARPIEKPALRAFAPFGTVSAGGLYSRRRRQPDGTKSGNA